MRSTQSERPIKKILIDNAIIDYHQKIYNRCDIVAVGFFLQHIVQTETVQTPIKWRTRCTSRTGNPRRRRSSSIQEVNKYNQIRSPCVGNANNLPEKNPKAFAFSNPGKLQRTAARSQDVRRLIVFNGSHGYSS